MSTLAIALGAAAGIPAGLVIDAVASRLALEWYRSPHAAEDEAEVGGAANDPLDDASYDESTPPRASRYETPPAALTAAGAPWRIALVVVVTVALFAIFGLRYDNEWWHLPVVAAFASVLLCCTETDFLAYRIPNAVVYPGIVGALVAGAVLPGADFTDVLLGGAISGGVFLLMALLPGNGLGDAKLGLFSGLALGFPICIPAILITALAGGAVAAILVVASRFAGLKRAIPYGPYIAFGAAVAFFLGGASFVRF